MKTANKQYEELAAVCEQAKIQLDIQAAGKRIGHLIAETEGGERSKMLREIKYRVDAISTLLYHAQRRDESSLVSKSESGR